MDYDYAPAQDKAECFTASPFTPELDQQVNGYNTSPTHLDDLVLLQGLGGWEQQDPTSPDRRSLSTISSVDGMSDLTGIAEDLFSGASASTEAFPGLEMPTVEEEVNTDHAQARVGRSVSRFQSSMGL